MQTVNVPPTQTSLGANCKRMWSSSAVSNLADGIFLVALPLVALPLVAARITDSPAAVAGVAFAGRLPWLVFVLFAGGLADRLDRRITMRNVQFLRVGVVAILVRLGDRAARRSGGYLRCWPKEDARRLLLRVALRVMGQPRLLPRRHAARFERTA